MNRQHAWEHDLKRLELGYEDEGYYNYRLQLGEAGSVSSEDEGKVRYTLFGSFANWHESMTSSASLGYEDQLQVQAGCELERREGCTASGCSHLEAAVNKHSGATPFHM